MTHHRDMTCKIDLWEKPISRFDDVISRWWVIGHKNPEHCTFHLDYSPEIRLRLSISVLEKNKEKWFSRKKSDLRYQEGTNWSTFEFLRKNWKLLFRNASPRAPRKSQPLDLTPMIRLIWTQNCTSEFRLCNHKSRKTQSVNHQNKRKRHPFRIPTESCVWPFEMFVIDFSRPFFNSQPFRSPKFANHCFVSGRTPSARSMTKFYTKNFKVTFDFFCL